MPFTFPYIPIVATFLPSLSNNYEVLDKILNNDEESSSRNPNIGNKGNPAKKDISFEIKPLKKAKENVVGKIDLAKSVEEISLEDLHPVVFLDKDFTDFNASPDEVAKDIMKEKDSEAEGVVFGGFVPASGSVRIAGRFK